VRSLFRCPVCGLALERDERAYRCGAGHSFDRAREGYVNLLTAAQRRSREPGDSAEMIRGRRAFLDTGAYDRFAAALSSAVAAHQPAAVLDAGCGEGSFTAGLPGGRRAGLDVSKPGVRLAAKRDPEGEYAVASAFALPVADGAVDALVSNFGPVDAAEFARVVRPGGVVIAAHPGPRHLFALRALVYDRPEPHEVKPPLRHDPERFEEIGSQAVTYEIEVASVPDLLTMTPYLWHMDDAARARLAATTTLATQVDVRITTYRRR
jgi:23S rRNA (guanine745-N1)-methyltransferase